MLKRSEITRDLSFGLCGVVIYSLQFLNLLEGFIRIRCIMGGEMDFEGIWVLRIESLKEFKKNFGFE